MFRRENGIGYKRHGITIGHALLNLFQLLVVHVLTLHRTNVVMVQHHLFGRQAFSTILALKDTFRLLLQTVLGRLHVGGQALFGGERLLTLRTLNVLFLSVFHTCFLLIVLDLMVGWRPIMVAVDVDMAIADFLQGSTFALDQRLLYKRRRHTHRQAHTKRG